jgi:hypothetical protein
MLGVSPLAQALHFQRKGPRVTVLHVADSTADLTTYTFTGVNFGDLGSVASIVDGYNTHPHVRVSGKKFIAVVVHGEDATTVFDVSGVTIGGVSGTERIDRAGTVTNSSAIYTWNTDSLQDITTTDIVVTWSEDVGACAIGVLLIENVGILGNPVNNVGGSPGTGAVSATPTYLTSNVDRDMLLLAASTCATGGGTERVQFSMGEVVSLISPCFAPMLLYEGSNAEFDYAAAWSYNPGYNPATIHGCTASWSGTGQSEIIVATFF